MFPLPHIIEYLLSLRDPGGRKLSWEGAGQLLIPAFPPGTTLILDTIPDGGIYLQLGFGLGFGNAMVPNTFTYYIEEWGFIPYSGTVTQWVITHTIPGFIITTAAQPLHMSVSNISPLVQYYEGFTFALNIASKEDHDMILEELRHLATSTKAEELAREANQLLGVMTAKPAPPPPAPPV